MTAYNCDTISAILKHKEVDSSITYSYYNVSDYIENIGFAYDIYGTNSVQAVRQVVYDMTYSNRLLDAIVKMNAPTNTSDLTKRAIDGMMSQVVPC